MLKFGQVLIFSGLCLSAIGLGDTDNGISEKFPNFVKYSLYIPIGTLVGGRF